MIRLDGSVEEALSEALYLYFPIEDMTYRIEDGSGENLLWEDRENGYVGYLNIDGYQGLDIDGDEIDGGMLLYRDSFFTEHPTLASLLKEAEEFADRMPMTTNRILFRESELDAVKRQVQNQKQTRKQPKRKQEEREYVKD